MSLAIHENSSVRRSRVHGVALAVLAVIYLIAGTGIVSDDYALIATLSALAPVEMVWPAASSIATPLLHLTHAWFYYLIGERQPLLYDCVKVVYLLLALHLLQRFFSLWFERSKAVVVAALFVFYPVHDATTYWFIGQYLLLSFAFLAYSFFLLHNGRTGAALASGAVGSFLSYGSSAVAGGLALIFLLRRDFRRAFLMLLPNLVYVAYYLVVTQMLDKGVGRIPSSMDFVQFIRQFFLQAATFVDVSIGPSFWLKMLLALGELSLSSALIAATTVLLISRWRGEPVRTGTGSELLLGASCIAVLALVMFAVTGLYPQLAFNLGDRVTIFGNFLMVIIIASLPLRRLQWLAVVTVYALAIFGIADHWKAWQPQQLAVMQKIRANPALRAVPPGALLYVSGNQYSRLGGISHIEFLSENFVARAVVAQALGTAPAYEIVSFNQRYHFDGQSLVDRKYGVKRATGPSISVYDSTADRVFELPAGAINEYLDRLPVERRSWVQFLGEGRLRNAVLYLMPRLQYAF